jgi:hypothetical protein
MPEQRTSFGNQDAALPLEMHHIVGNESVSTLYKVKRNLAFADAGPTGEEQADAVHIDHRPMHRRLRREVVVQARDVLVYKPGGAELGPQERDLALLRQLSEF